MPTTNNDDYTQDTNYTDSETGESTETRNMYTTKTNDSDYQSIINDVNSDSLLQRVLHSNGIYEKESFNDWGTFYRFQRMDPYRIAPNTTEYLFFTKPDLHIFEGNTGDLNPELAAVPLFVDMMNRGYKGILQELEYSIDTSCPFIRGFTNLKRSNLDLTAISAQDQETASNMFGTKTTYRKSSFASDEDADFNIEFEDSKYLEVYLWFRAYDEYERKKFEGKVTPPSQWYTINKVLHDQMTVFKFIVGENGEDIIHYSRITGCYPKNVNRDAFSDMPADGHIKLTTQWKGTFVRDMDPSIIAHFNKITNADGVSGTGTSELWDSEIQSINGEDVTMPYVEIATPANSNYQVYRLKWRNYSG